MTCQFDRDALITYMVLSECQKVVSERQTMYQRGGVPVKPGIVQRVWVMLQDLFSIKRPTIQPVAPSTHFLSDAIMTK